MRVRLEGSGLTPRHRGPSSFLGEPDAAGRGLGVIRSDVRESRYVCFPAVLLAGTPRLSDGFLVPGDFTSVSTPQLVLALTFCSEHRLPGYNRISCQVLGALKPLRGGPITRPDLSHAREGPRGTRQFHKSQRHSVYSKSRELGPRFPSELLKDFRDKVGYRDDPRPWSSKCRAFV